MNWMVRILSATLLIMLLIGLPSYVYAEERQKATVALIFVNNARTTYDDELTARTMEKLHKKVDGIYNVVGGDAYLEIFSKAGITNPATAERQELISAVRLAGDKVDYLLVSELQPFNRKEKITVFTYGKDMIATFALKIIDVVNEKYLYNGKFIVKASDSTTDWLIGNKSVAFMALDSTLIQVGEVISFRLPLHPPKPSLIRNGMADI